MTEQVATPAPPGPSARVARRAGTVLDAIAARPRLALSFLVAAQVAATVALGLATAHNGWAWFQGGEQVSYSTDGWLLGRLRLPPGDVGYGWPLVLSPLTWVTGPTWLQAMPVIAALNVLVLGPVALLCVYGIGSRLAGRLVGLLAALAWVAAPYAAIPLWVSVYEERWVDRFLPQALGLTALPDLPATATLLAGAWLLLRGLDGRSWTDAAAGGLLAGYAGAMRPACLLFLAGAVAAVTISRRWREGLAFGLAVAPALLTLLLWKHRGLASVPTLDELVDLDWGRWERQMSDLREFSRGARLLQWAPLAGAAALALRRRWTGLGLLLGWLAAFLALKGTAPEADVEAGTFFRVLLPAWPAYLLLAAPLVLLVPTAARRLGERLDPPPVTPLRRRWVAVAGVALAALPLLVVALARPLDGPDRALFLRGPQGTALVPVDGSVAVEAREDGATRSLTWDSGGGWRADVSYVVLRTRGAEPDVSCAPAGVTRCTLTMVRLGETTSTRFVDGSPPPGATYRVGVAADYRGEPGGDVFAVSEPVRAAP